MLLVSERPRKLLQQIILFIRRAVRANHTDRLTARASRISFSFFLQPQRMFHVAGSSLPLALRTSGEVSRSGSLQNQNRTVPRA